MTSEVVFFEVADIAASARLAERLAARWNVLLTERWDLVVVVAELRSGGDDVAVLLREVEAWVEEESLCAIWYELDGRGYVLEAGEADWSADVAVEATVDERRARLLDALDSVDRAISRRGPHIRGLAGLRDDIVFALRLDDDESS